MKWERIFGIFLDAEVVLHDPIDDSLLQQSPKLTQSLFCLSFACGDGFCIVPAWKCRMMYFSAALICTTVYLSTYQALEQVH